MEKAAVNLYELAKRGMTVKDYEEKELEVVILREQLNGVQRRMDSYCGIPLKHFSEDELIMILQVEYDRWKQGCSYMGLGG
jgi:hypothetical protein